jgi:hypothetical protein
MPIMDDEIINVPVPRRYYLLIIQTLAAALAGDSQGAPNPTAVNRKWTPAEISELRAAIKDNKTAFALMELTCASPAKRVSFEQIYKHANTSYPQARADLARLTRLIEKRFGGARKWPVNSTQTPGKGVLYEAMPDIAVAWNTWTRERKPRR